MHTDRVFHLASPAPSTAAPTTTTSSPSSSGTFTGAGFSDYTLIYHPTPPTELKATYVGAFVFHGALHLPDGRELVGGFTAAVQDGTFVGLAKASWILLDGCMTGALQGVVKGGKGGYESKGMKDADCWLELELV